VIICQHQIQPPPHSLRQQYSLLLQGPLFLTGLAGSFFIVKRQVSRELPEPATGITQMEQFILQRTARLMSLKAFATGTLVCLSGASILAWSVGALMGVRNIQEFHQKMNNIIPKYSGFHRIIPEELRLRMHDWNFDFDDKQDSQELKREWDKYMIQSEEYLNAKKEKSSWWRS